MKKQKIEAFSTVLKRNFFVDFFTTNEKAPLLIIYFGGSGVGRNEYLKRGRSIVPIFDNCFSRLREEFDFAFCYVSSPPDVNIVKLGNSEEETQLWCQHMEDEVMPLLPDVPFYFIGYSGGIVLATCGLHLSQRCLGGGALGGDQLQAHIEKGVSWKEPLALYYNLSDVVYQKNAGIIDKLQENGTALCYRKLPGAHDIHDYLANGSFSGLMRRAQRIFGGCIL